MKGHFTGLILQDVYKDLKKLNEHLWDNFKYYGFGADISVSLGYKF